MAAKKKTGEEDLEKCGEYERVAANNEKAVQW
jgi:hypothetical protein